MLHIAKSSDRDKFYDLWQICFGDSDAFCDWFFQNRFAPDYSVYLEIENTFVACMQAYPYHIWIRNHVVSGAMMCGVCTHPNHRKKGYMGQVFPYDMNLLRKKEIAVAVHTPAVLNSYFSFGHFPVADACYLTVSNIPLLQQEVQAFLLSEEQWENAYPCYQSFAMAYSGMVARSKQDFLRKCADYAADGGKCMALEKDHIVAYVWYYPTETQIQCVEAVGPDDSVKMVLQAIMAQYPQFSLSAKLPPKTKITFPFAQKEVKQKGVMGLVNFPLLLKQLDLQSDIAFLVTDDVVSENNGCFLLNGNKSQSKPAFSIPAGRLMQVLVGYVTLEEQRDYVEIYDKVGFETLNQLLPKQNCFIIDEY